MSKCTIGAMASKKASAASSVSARIASARAGEVRGPVATITLIPVGRRQAGDLAARDGDEGMGGEAGGDGLARTARGRRRARRRRAGRGGRPSAMTRPPAARISQCKRPTAFCSSSSERKELEQTSSARAPVWWAKVPVTGRISCRTTGTPISAACQAASEPARPPPMTWIGAMSHGSDLGQRRGKGRVRRSRAAALAGVERTGCPAPSPAAPGGRRRWRGSSGT